MRVVSFVVGLFALIGLAVVAGVAALTVLIVRSQPSVPDSVVLELVLDQKSLTETSDDGLEKLLRSESSFDSTLDALERARIDPRVKGLVVRMGGEGPGTAQVQELRAAVDKFRATGRFALAFAGDYGNSSYLLASAFDEVWLQPLGMVAITGPAAEAPFARDALDMLGVEPQVEKREEYKTAPNAATERGFTPAEREMMTSLVEDLARQMSEAIAKNRRLQPAEVRALIDRAPLLDREAYDAHLVDRVGYRDEMEDEALRRSGDAEIMDLAEYRSAAGSPFEKGPKIAMIHAVGAITDGEKDEDAADSFVVTPGRLVPAIENAADDDEIAAIVLRIDSGGGSVSASEAIRRAVAEARDAGKPVIVSMGNTAASGGYWIAMNANKIVADPGTLTGSIGVFAGKASVKGLSDKLGIHWDFVGAGRNADMWSPFRPFGDGGRERLKAITDGIYSAFLTKIAEARRMTPDAVRDAARGRVWTGAQARERGLVDELGGRDVALACAREAAGLPADADIQLVPFPEPKSLFEEIASLFKHDKGLIEGARTMTALRPWLGAIRRTIQSSAAAPQMRMPPVDVK